MLRLHIFMELLEDGLAQWVMDSCGICRMLETGATPPKIYISIFLYYNHINYNSAQPTYHQGPEDQLHNITTSV